ncbi:MAG: ATP-binding cassette domain-containing protein [Candidatus Liberibacter ctenarytainae]|uniref:ATP-binding cassette domain-containing protein n=1 Tax=Candidatus Liberibacter ctenarytainae TaxID=2020335 RepID=A0A937DLM6_9HYPH|nr:ATP-binding cassette domain-containing protein [Candidatus Liberibacter ctenarytainae]
MSYLQYFYEFKKIYNSKLYLIILPSILINILYLTNPLYMMHIYDSVIGTRSDINLIAISTITLFLYALFFGFDVIRSRIFIDISHSIECSFKSYIIAVTKKHNLDDPLLLLTISALDQLKKFIRSPALPALFDLLFTPIFIILSLCIHPILGLWAIISAIILLIITYFFSMKNALLNQACEKKRKDEIFWGEAIFNQPEYMHMSTVRDFLLTHWDKKRSSTQKHQLLADKTTFLGESLIKTLRMTLQSSILGLGSWLVMHQNLSAGSIIATSIITTRAIAPLEQIMNAKKSLKIGLEALKHLLDLRRLAGPESFDDQNINRSTEALLNGNITIKNITLHHKDTLLPICQNLSFMIPEGTCCTITGPSGCGKTRFLLCALGLISPKNGTVLFGGRNATLNLLERFSSKISYLSQNCTLFPVSIADNITLSNNKNILDTAQKAAETIGFHNTICSLEEGYQTIVSSHNISYSLMQNIRLARIVAQNPDIILMDEPLLYLDSSARNNFYILLEKFKKSGKTIVIISHDPTIINMSDVSLVFHPITGPIFGPTKNIFRSKHTDKTINV